MIDTERIEYLRQELRYRRERLALYKARLYRGRAASEARLRELERSADGAESRLRRANAERSKRT